jgi:hypothetical protein
MLKASGSLNCEAAEFVPKFQEEQPLIPYAEPLGGRQTSKLNQLLKTDIIMSPIEEAGLLPIRFKLEEFVQYVMDQGLQPVLIGGAAQSIVVDKEHNDTDIAVFFQEKPPVESFINFAHQFFYRKFRLGIEDFKKYVRLNCSHESMESKMLDFKFLSFLDRTHLFNHDALCVELQNTPKRKVVGWLTTVLGANTGMDEAGFREAMDCLVNKRLAISNPSTSRKALFRVVDCMTKGFICNQEIRDTVSRHLAQEKYSAEMFQRELKFYLLGHVRQEKQQLYCANLKTFFEQLPQNPEVIAVKDILRGMIPQNHYANTLLESLKGDPSLKIGHSSDIPVSQGVLLRSKNEHHEILEILEASDPILDLLYLLQQREYKKIPDCLEYVRGKGHISLEQQVRFAQNHIIALDRGEKQEAIHRVAAHLSQKAPLEERDLVTTLCCLLKDKEALEYSSSLFLLDDLLCSRQVDQEFVHKIRHKLLKNVGIHRLDTEKKIRWIQEKTIDGTSAIGILEKELVSGENRSSFTAVLGSLDDELLTSIAKKIYLKKHFEILLSLPTESVKSALCQLSLDELLEGLDPALFQQQFRLFFDPILEVLGKYLSALEPKGLKQKLSDLSPSLRTTLLININLYEILIKKEARELVDTKCLDASSTEHLINFFAFLIKDRKRLDSAEGQILAKIIERQEDHLFCPTLFKRLGDLLLTLEEIPKESCLTLFRTFPADKEENYPDWIKAVLLKFYATKSAASTPINEFKAILRKPISPQYLKVVSPLTRPFFTNSCRQVVESKDLDQGPVIPSIFRFCPIEEKGAIGTFKEILDNTTNFETINVRLNDLLSFAVEMAEVSPKVSLESFDLLANFLLDGVKRGNRYSFERVFLTFFTGLEKAYPLLKDHSTSSARIKRLVATMTQVIFDGKNRSVLEWMGGARAIFDLDVMPQDPLILKAASCHFQEVSNCTALMSKIHTDFIVPQKSCLESLVAMGILNQRLFDEFRQHPHKEQFLQDQIPLLVNVYLITLMHFRTLPEKEQSAHLPICLEIFHDAMVFEQENRLSLFEADPDEEFHSQLGGLKSSIADIILTYMDHTQFEGTHEQISFLIDNIFDAMIGIKDIVTTEENDPYEGLLLKADWLLCTILSLPEGEMQVKLFMKMKEKYCQAGHKIQHSAIQTNIKQAIHELGSNLFKNFMLLAKKELDEEKKFLFKQALREVSDTMRLF